MTEDDAKRAAMDGDWETVARYVVRSGLARPIELCLCGEPETMVSEALKHKCVECSFKAGVGTAQAQSPMSHAADAFNYMMNTQIWGARVGAVSPSQAEPALRGQRARQIIIDDPMVSWVEADD